MELFSRGKRKLELSSLHNSKDKPTNGEKPSSHDQLLPVQDTVTGNTLKQLLHHLTWQLLSPFIQKITTTNRKMSSQRKGYRKDRQTQKYDAKIGTKS